MSGRRITAVSIVLTLATGGANLAWAQRRPPRGGTNTTSTSPAQRTGSPEVRPSEEVQISAPTSASAQTTPRGDRTDLPEGDAPENLEERLYLRDRPDTLGAAAHAFEDALLERLLHEREALVVSRRDEAIRLLEDFVAREPASAAEMPDALLRLAELRWEDTRARYLAAFAEYQQVPEEYRAGHPEPRADYTIPLALYDRILDNYRGFPRYDFVLYMKAYALLDSARLEDALVQYRRIIAEFPQSRFVADAHFALAEAAFNGSFDYAAALAEYDLVMQHQDSELYDVALFKSAWCMWRMGQTTEAARRFRQVLDLAQNRAGLTSAQRRRIQELQDEALNYLIQVFTEDERNTAQDVFRFLEEIGGERYATRVLERLSAAFYDQARYDRGVDAYKLLLTLDPNAAGAPEFQRQIVVGYSALEDAPHALEALEALCTMVGADAPWARNQTDPEVVRAARGTAERMLREQALKAHERAQRDAAESQTTGRGGSPAQREAAQRERNQQRFAPVADMYRLYLRHFPDSDASYEIRFYLGEVLFHRLGQNAEAGETYLAAAQQKHDGRFTRDALYNAITAFERVRESEMTSCTGATPAPQSPAPQSPTPPANAPSPTQGAQAAQACGETDNDRKFSTAIELYVQLFPNDPDLPEILFRQGKLYYDHGVFDPAVRLFGQLLERFPQNQYAADAGDLIIQSFQRAQDYANIETWARRLKTAPAFAGPEAQSRLNTLILQAVFKLGEQLAGRGEHAQAAEAYFRAAEEFPTDERARQAYYNAGLERQRAGDVSGAAHAYDRLIERHPGSVEGALGAWAAAQMYESIASFGDAARYYEQYEQRFPQGEKAQDALYNAVVLRISAGDHDEAANDGRRFLERYPRSDTADDVYFLIGRAHEAEEHWADAAQTYREYIRRTRNQGRKCEALTRLSQVLVRTGDARNADAALDQAVSMGRRSANQLGDGVYYAAQARYLQAERVYTEYEAVQLQGDLDGLPARLERKMQLLNRAATIYADVVQFRVAEWVTAALFRIGQIFEGFAESLRAYPIPEGLSEEENQAYQDALQGQIVPVEERALEAYEGGYRKALELRIYNSWTAKLREALTRLNDVEYPPLREMGGDIVQSSPLVLPVPLDGLRRGDAATPRPAVTQPSPAPTGAQAPARGEARPSTRRGGGGGR